MVTHILHIEDDPVLLQIVVEALRRRWPQAQVTQVGSLAEATQALAQGHPPHLIFSDHQLPDGRATNWLALQRDIQNVPVVIISGTSLSADEKNKLGQRPFTLLHKPVRPQLIVQALQSLLGE